MAATRSGAYSISLVRICWAGVAEDFLDGTRVSEAPALDMRVGTTDGVVRKDMPVDRAYKLAVSLSPAGAIGIDDEDEEIGDVITDPPSRRYRSLPGPELAQGAPVAATAARSLDDQANAELARDAAQQGARELLMAAVLAVEIDPRPITHPATHGAAWLRPLRRRLRGSSRRDGSRHLRKAGPLLRME